MTTAQEITRRLIADYKFKLNGEWLQQGKCPACNAYEAYTKADRPYYIYCSKQNKCGVSTKVRDLYPDLFGQYNKKYKATRTNHNATADAYMKIERGFELEKIKGWYTQGKWGNTKNGGTTATVRFLIADGVYMERFVETIVTTDPETGEKISRKQSFKGSFQGLAWIPPILKADASGQDWIEDGDQIWITEGIIDAISLNMNGYKAIASLSAQHYPEKTLETLKDKNITLVWALDNDTAGKKWMKRHAERSKKDGFTSIAAYIPTKSGAKDWNELHIKQGIDDKIISDSKYHGLLLLAQTAKEKATLIFNKTSSRFFCIEFGKQTYAVNVTVAKEDEEERDVVNLSLIANFAINFQYFMRNEIIDESWYVAKISFPHKGGEILCKFNGAQISSAAEFKKRVISVAAGAVFTGVNAHLNWLCQTHLFGIKTVETIDYIGYSKAHNIYLLDELAFHKGQMFKRNPQEYFDIGNTSITTLQRSINLDIGSARDYTPNWIEPFYTTFGDKGIVALAFWMGTLFAEQIRAKHSSFPFLEIVGEAGSGKTSLIEFMWKLYGRPDEEGFDPAKATAAGISRKFTQVSNLPIVLIEADRDADAVKAKKFDWEELKPMYNGRGTRTRGVKNSGNETYDPPFRAALVIAQNEAVNASPAIMQRFIHCEFNKDTHNAEAKISADQLSLMNIENVSHFVAKVLMHEETILKPFFERFEKYENFLIDLPEIKTRRIAKNHAQILAITDALFMIVALSEEQQKQIRIYIKDMAIERERAIGGDHPVVEQFWEIFDYLDSIPENTLNHSRKHDKGEIALSLNEYVEIAYRHNQSIPPLDQLKKHLRSGSKTRPLVKTNHPINSRKNNQGTLRCWVFNNTQFEIENA